MRNTFFTVLQSQYRPKELMAGVPPRVIFGDLGGPQAGAIRAPILQIIHCQIGPKQADKHMFISSETLSFPAKFRNNLTAMPLFPPRAYVSPLNPQGTLDP